MTELVNPHRQQPDGAGRNIDKSPRQKKSCRKGEYPEKEFTAVFLPVSKSCFLLGGERRNFCSLRLANELPENDSAAEALDGLRLVLELAFRTLHGRGLYPRKIALCPRYPCVY